MVLADAKDVQPDLIGQLDFGHQLAHPRFRARTARHFHKGVET